MSSFVKEFASMQTKRHLSTGFISELTCLLDLISEMHSDHHELITWVNLYSLFKKVNPKKVLLNWNMYVYNEFKSKLKGNFKGKFKGEFNGQSQWVI